MRLVTDTAVTNSQKACPVFKHGTDLYVVGLDYSSPTTYQPRTDSANFHIYKSSNNGLTWVLQDDSNGPGVYQTLATLNGTPALSPRFTIEVPLDPVTHDAVNNPFVVTTGVNDTLQVSLFTYGFFVVTYILVIPPGSYGLGPGPDAGGTSIATQVAAALNAQLVTQGVSTYDLNFIVDAQYPDGIQFYGGTAITLESKSFIGSHWSFVYEGNLINPPDPPDAAFCSLSPDGGDTGTYTVYGVDSGSYPVSLLFNTFDATLSNGLIYVCYTGVTPGLGLKKTKSGKKKKKLTPLSPSLAVSVFDCTSNTWAYNILNGPDLTPVVYDTSYGNNIKCDLAVSIKVRSNGQIVAAYAMGHSEGQTSADIYNTSWTVYDPIGLTWSTPVQILSRYESTPISSVIDSSDNFILILAINLSSAANTPYTFVVKSDNSVVAYAPMDTSPPSYMTLISNQDSSYQGPIQGITIHGDQIVYGANYGYPADVLRHAYMFENTATRILAGEPWTIFRSPDYITGAYQWSGLNDTTLWNNQFLTVFGSSVNPNEPGGSGSLIFATGDSTGGAQDTSWSASDLLFALPGFRVPYSVSVVSINSTTFGVLYSYFDFNTVVAPTPNWYTHFAVFSTVGPQPITITGTSGAIQTLVGRGFIQGQNPFFVPPPTVSAPNIMFRPVRAPIASRYSGSLLVDFLDGRQSFVASWNAIRILNDPTDLIFPVPSGMEGRLDIISLTVYGREDLWWVIAQANDMQNPFFEPSIGDQLRIPTLTRVLKILGQTGTGTEPSRYQVS